MIWARSERIAHEAAAWTVWLDGDDLKPRDIARFRRWLAKSEQHRQAFQHANRVWTDLDQLERLKSHPEIAALLASVDEPAPETSAHGVNPGALDRRALLMGAGAGALALGLGGYALLAPQRAEAYETDFGEQRELTFADGTRVTLNAASRIEARVTAARRQVRLVRGEALLVVADSNWGPFVVETPAGTVETQSGQILVKLLPDGARVGLMSEPAILRRRALLGAGEPISAAAGHEIVLAGDSVQMRTAAPDQLERRALWREGVLAFENTTLAEATADVTRQTGARFVFADRDLAQVRVGGLIRADDLAAFRTLLRESLAIESESRGDNIVLRSAAL